MSSFPGIMEEYRHMSIDRFDGANLEAAAYFLSHKHTDHMHGLADDALLYRLKSNQKHIKLYCSPITRQLLLADSKYKHLEDSLVALPLNEVEPVEVVSNTTGKVLYTVDVTLLPAGHCPGSVMFLFEGVEGRVLYTGDFRLGLADIQAMKALHEGDNTKPIQSLYVDTTFCVPQALYIPSRAESTAAVVSLVEDWFSQGPQHHIVLRTRAYLGYEQLYVDLAEHFNTKVHVNNEKQEVYSQVSELPEFSTSDAADTRIHACTWHKERHADSTLPCGHMPQGQTEVKVKVIQLSTMWFTQQVNCRDYSVKVGGRHRVCYSFHSSYGEVRDLVMYLQPNKVSANVIPMNETKKQVNERLQKFLSMARSGVDPVLASQSRALGAQKKRVRAAPTDSCLPESEDSLLTLAESTVEKKTDEEDCEKKKSNGEGPVWKSIMGDESPMSSEGEQNEDIHDDEVASTQRVFSPVEHGSLGSFLAYISDPSDGEDIPQSEINTQRQQDSAQTIGEANKNLAAGSSAGGSAMETVRDTVFVTGMPTDTNTQAVAEHFGSIGIIKDDARGRQRIWLYKDKKSGEMKGEGTITYEDEETAQSAIAWFNGKDFHGNILKVELAQRKVKPPGTVTLDLNTGCDVFELIDLTSKEEQKRMKKRAEEEAGYRGDSEDDDSDSQSPGKQGGANKRKRSKDSAQGQPVAKKPADEDSDSDIEIVGYEQGDSYSDDYDSSDEDEGEEEDGDHYDYDCEDDQTRSSHGADNPLVIDSSDDSSSDSGPSPTKTTGKRPGPASKTMPHRMGDGPPDKRSRVEDISEDDSNDVLELASSNTDPNSSNVELGSSNLSITEIDLQDSSVLEDEDTNSAAAAVSKTDSSKTSEQSKSPSPSDNKSSEQSKEAEVGQGDSDKTAACDLKEGKDSITESSTGTDHSVKVNGDTSASDK